MKKGLKMDIKGLFKSKKGAHSNRDSKGRVDVKPDSNDSRRLGVIPKGYEDRHTEHYKNKVKAHKKVKNKMAKQSRKKNRK